MDTPNLEMAVNHWDSSFDHESNPSLVARTELNALKAEVFRLAGLASDFELLLRCELSDFYGHDYWLGWQLSAAGWHLEQTDCKTGAMVTLLTLKDDGTGLPTMTPECRALLTQPGKVPRG